jgi:hypothetical protein
VIGDKLELYQLPEDEARARLAEHDEHLERLEAELEREDRLAQHAPAIASSTSTSSSAPAPADEDRPSMAERLGVLFLAYARPPPNDP